MRQQLIAEAAERLWRAEQHGTPIEPLTECWNDLSDRDAYAIATENLRRREAAVIGYKLGFTSEAMRRQMSIADPNYGVLTGDHEITQAPAVIDTSRLVHPLIEPEIGLLIGHSLDSGGNTAESVRRHVAAVAPCLEIVDTRYQAYRFRAADNIADNSSSARFVRGTPTALERAGDLRQVSVLLSVDGAVVDEGMGANAMGDPLAALAWLANTLSAAGRVLREGDIVLTGGLTRAHPAKRGSFVTGKFSGLGDVGVSFT